MKPWTRAAWKAVALHVLVRAAYCLVVIGLAYTYEPVPIEEWTHLRVVCWVLCASLAWAFILAIWDGVMGKKEEPR